jgi:hypothetical protein
LPGAARTAKLADREIRDAMKKSFHTMIPVAALAWLVAGAASAAQPLQDAPPAAKPVQAEAAKTADKAAKQANQAKQAEQSTDESVVQERKSDAKQGGVARANREVLEPIAFEQARYTKRLAQLERIKEIAAEKNNDQLNQQAEALRIKNEEHHSSRMAEFRTKYGAEKVDAALAWIDRRVKERGNLGVVRGAKDKQKDTGNAVDNKTRQEAKEKKERTDEMKEKAKEKVKGETKP